jgi:hypothetical protein
MIGGMNRPTPIPLRPDPAALRSRGAQALVRTVAARAIAEFEQGHWSAMAQQRWSDDRDVELIIRAATSPATTTGGGWANSLASTALADFIASMGPAYAGAALLTLGLQLQFSRATAIMVPGMIAEANKVGFVGESQPIPVQQFSTAGLLLDPRSFKVITTFTPEIFQHSTPTIESLVRAVLTESVGLALDAALLDATAGDANRPPGLRYGIAALPASTDSNKSVAMAEDIGTLATAVAAVAGNTAIVFIAAPAQAVALRLWAPNSFRYAVMASSGLTSGVVMAIAPNTLASATDPVPRIDRATETTLHMDTSPSQFATAGTPNVVAAPMRVLLQNARATTNDLLERRHRVDGLVEDDQFAGPRIYASRQ